MLQCAENREAQRGSSPELYRTAGEDLNPAVSPRAGTCAHYTHFWPAAKMLVPPLPGRSTLQPSQCPPPSRQLLPCGHMSQQRRLTLLSIRIFSFQNTAELDLSSAVSSCWSLWEWSGHCYRGSGGSRANTEAQLLYVRATAALLLSSFMTGPSSADCMPRG